MKYKKIFIIEVFILIVVGCLMVYSSSSIWANFKFHDHFYYLKRQVLFAIVGFVLMILFSKINLDKIKKYNKLLLILGFISLVLVLIPGIGISRNGSRSWFSFFSFLVQPSEFMKVILILNISDILSKKNKIKKIKDFIYPLLLMGLSFILILFQPDFGSGVVLLCSLIIVLFCANVPYKYFAFLFMIGIISFLILIVSAPYRLERILSFLNPWKDPLGSGFQIIQSLYALGPAGFFGLSFSNSIQKNFYLPEPQTDFIFAIFGEEFGFIGCALLIILLLTIIFNGVKIAQSCESNYKFYVSIGVISMFAIQVMINLGVVVGLFLVTGITLPLVSYGGSSMIVMLSSFGLLLSNTNR